MAQLSYARILSVLDLVIKNQPPLIQDISIDYKREVDRWN